MWKYLLLFFVGIVLSISVYFFMPPIVGLNEVSTLTPEVVPIENRILYEKLKAFQEAQQLPINLYGYVSDRDKQPIADVEITYSSGVFGKVMTDEHGMFHIQAEGQSLQIRKLIKEGYEFRKKQLPSFYPIKYSPNLLLWKDTSPVRPFNFQGYKITKVEPLVHDRLRVRVKRNAGFQPISLPLINDNLLFNFSSQTISTNERRKDWKVSITVANGGLIESSGDITGEAPASGYETTWSRSLSTSNGTWKDVIRPEFFIRSGKYYGKISLRLDPYFSDTPNSGVGATYWINSNGSRNLHFDSRYLTLVYDGYMVNTYLGDAYGEAIPLK